MRSFRDAIVRRIAGSRGFRITAEGRWFLLITLGVGIAAMNTGNNLLYLALGMNLSLVILSGLLSESSLRGLRVEVKPVTEAFAGRDAYIAVTCSAASKRFPGFSPDVRLSLDGRHPVVRFPDVRPGREATRLVPFRFGRRGEVPPPEGRVSTLFPFGLFEKSAPISAGLSLVVYPEPADSPLPGESQDAEGPEKVPAASGRPGPWILGAREMVPSDAMRDIHWKASARLGKWMAKEREKEAGAAMDLVVPRDLPPEEFERALSRACGLVLRWEREGRPYRIRIGDGPGVGPECPGRRTAALSLLALAAADSAR